MFPVLTLRLWDPPLHVGLYGLSLLLGALVAWVSGCALARGGGLSLRRVVPGLVLMTLVAPIGGRLFYAATHSAMFRQDRELLWALHPDHLSMFGALLSSTLTGSLLAKWLSLDLATLADALTPGLGLGIAAARVGCFLAGCCFGRTTRVPWAVTFPWGSECHAYQIARDFGSLVSGPRAVHPTQLYESLAALVGGVVALGLVRSKAQAGGAFLLFMAAYAAFRAVNEFIRAPSLASTVPPWFFPSLYGAIALAAAALYGHGRERRVVSRGRGDHRHI